MSAGTSSLLRLCRVTVPAAVPMQQTAEAPEAGFEVPPEPTPRHRNTWVRDLLEVLLIAVVLYGVIWTCIQTVKVDGESMIPTLQNGDFLIASKISYHLGSPQRGDIVILNPPPYCDQGSATNGCEDPAAQARAQTDFIKRVIGVPGDNVEIDGNQHPTALMIQPGGTGTWQRASEPYLPNDWTQFALCCKADGTQTNRPSAFHVPSGEYFVLGDNRNQSNDSRFFGLIPQDKILAKAVLRIWPLDRFGGLGAGPTLVAAPGFTATLLLFLRRRRRSLRRELERFAS